MIRSYKKIWLKMRGWAKNFAGLTSIKIKLILYIKNSGI